MAKKGILLDQDNDLFIKNKSLQLGNPEMQETQLILQMNQGELKFYPLLGANLVRMIRGKQDPLKIKRQVKVHLNMDRKDYEKIKDKITIK